MKPQPPGTTRTARYTPPRIEHLSEIEALIAATAGVVIRDKRPKVHTVDHLLTNVDWGGDPRIRELRGLAFDAETGRIAARPIHKFFEWCKRGVNPGTAGPPHDAGVSEKVDGTLVFPARTSDGGITWCTRGGATGHVARAVGQSDPRWLAAARKLTVPIDGSEEPLTPSFEWTGPESKIVRYATASLRLIAVRRQWSGEYLDREELRALLSQAARDTGVPIATVAGATEPWVPGWWPARATWREIAEAAAHGPPGAEGVVLDWPDGLRAKLKLGWFLRLQKVRETPDKPGIVLNACLHEDRSEILDRICDRALRERLGEIWDNVHQRVEAHSAGLQAIVDRLDDQYEDDDRGFAIELERQIPDDIRRHAGFRTRHNARQGRATGARAEILNALGRLVKTERGQHKLLANGGFLHGIGIPAPPVPKGRTAR